jgi:hypothetical protein
MVRRGIRRELGTIEVVLRRERTTPFPPAAAARLSGGRNNLGDGEGRSLSPII